MDREQRIDLLNRALHGVANSVVQYIDAATPYVPPGCEEKMADLARVREEEARSAHEIVELISDLDGVPQVDVFPYWNVDLNYLDVRFLCRFAAKQLVKTIAELEEIAAAARQDSRVRTLLATLLPQRRRHLEVLNEIGAIAGPEADEARRKKAQPAEAQHVPRPLRTVSG